VRFPASLNRHRPWVITRSSDGRPAVYIDDALNWFLGPAPLRGFSFFVWPRPVRSTPERGGTRRRGNGGSSFAAAHHARARRIAGLSGFLTLIQSRDVAGSLGYMLWRHRERGKIKNARRALRSTSCRTGWEDRGSAG
jgi:hypothetical protein